MPDDPAKTSEEDPKQDPPEEDPPKQDPPVGKDGTPFDPERAQRALDAAREAEKKAKAEAREAKEKADKYDELTEQQKTELEKAQDRAAKAEEKAKDADSKLQRANLVASLADPKYGIVNARAAAKLIDGVEFNDEGEPTNLGDPEDGESVIGKFLADNAYLQGTPPKPKAPSTDANAGGNEDAPTLTAEQLDAAKAAGMDPKEYAALSKEGGVSLDDLDQAGLTGDADKT